MEPRALGRLWPVSPLTIGGGGLGQVWGDTDRDEAVATLRLAIDSGITLIDVAPGYGDGEAERVVGDAFAGALPDGVRVCTKVHVGHARATEVEDVVTTSLDESLARMRIPFVDLYLLHSQIVPEPDLERGTWTTPLALFEEATRAVFEKLVERGRIGAWGITAVQFPDALDAVLSSDPAPQVAQMVANVLDATGDMQWSRTDVSPRDLASRVRASGVGVMGIRAVQAGALTDGIDRALEPDDQARTDFDRAAPFRTLAAELGETAASLAHRYALSMDNIDTVVLGVKNRSELGECLRAAEVGPLSAEEMAMIDDVVAPLRPEGLQHP